MVQPPLHAVGGHDPLGADADYVALEHRIDAAEADAIRARWEFGLALLAERQANGGKQLPHGRLDEICDAIGKPRSAFGREAQWRMQFAERCASELEVRTAVRTYGSWTAIRDWLAGADERYEREAAADERRKEWEKLARIIAARPSPEYLDSLWKGQLQRDPEWRARRVEGLAYDAQALIEEAMHEVLRLRQDGYRIDGYTIDRDTLVEALRTLADWIDTRRRPADDGT